MATHIEKVRELNHANLKNLSKEELKKMFRSEKVCRDFKLVTLEILEKRNVMMCPKCGVECRRLTREEIGEKTHPNRLTMTFYCIPCNKTYEKGMKKHHRTPEVGGNNIA